MLLPITEQVVALGLLAVGTFVLACNTTAESATMHACSQAHARIVAVSEAIPAHNSIHDNRRSSLGTMVLKGRGQRADGEVHQLDGSSG